MSFDQPGPKFYDVKAIAEMFGMSRMTVYRAIRAGELAAVRIRGRYIVPGAVIDALVANAETAAEERADQLHGAAEVAR